LAMNDRSAQMALRGAGSVALGMATVRSAGRRLILLAGEVKGLI